MAAVTAGRSWHAPQPPPHPDTCTKGPIAGAQGDQRPNDPQGVTHRLSDTRTTSPANSHPDAHSDGGGVRQPASRPRPARSVWRLRRRATTRASCRAGPLFCRLWAAGQGDTLRRVLAWYAPTPHSVWFGQRPPGGAAAWRAWRSCAVQVRVEQISRRIPRKRVFGPIFLVESPFAACFTKKKKRC